MRITKIPILQHDFLGYNDSGEEMYDWVDNGLYIIGKVAYNSSTDDFSADRNAGETVIKVYCETIYEWVNRRDRFVYKGKTWTIDLIPEAWENNVGYRNAFVITGKHVEG